MFPRLTPAQRDKILAIDEGHSGEISLAADAELARNGAIVRMINKFPDPPNKDVGEGMNTAFTAMRQLRLKPPEIAETETSVIVNIKHESALRKSPATAKHEARFIIATDGQTIQAERFDDGEALACDFKDLPNRFAYFLSLAGISTVKRIDENAFDIRATGRLNKLHVELLRTNPDWDTKARREDLNHFFTRLIFCFFAEDTNIFPDSRLFTDTEVLQMDKIQSRHYAGLPSLAMAAAMPVGGWLMGRLESNLGRVKRFVLPLVSMLASAGCLLAGLLAVRTPWIVLWFTAALGFLGLCESAFWVTAIELGGRRAGTSAAIMNTGGNGIGLLAPILTPLISRRFGWSGGLCVGALVAVAGAMCWLGIRRRASDMA